LTIDICFGCNSIFAVLPRADWLWLFHFGELEYLIIFGLIPAIEKLGAQSGLTSASI